jgi:hypothetical protein
MEVKMMSKRSRILRVVASFIIVSLIFLALPAGPALAQSMSISASSGQVGSQVTVSGTAFTANVSYQVYFGYGSSFYQVFGASSNTSSSGTFSVVSTIPSVPAGTYTFSVTYGSSNLTGPSFTVTPAVIVSPTSVHVNDQVAVSGTGFSASKTATITFDSISITCIVTTSYGAVTTVYFNIPDSYAGVHYVTINDGTYSASTQVSVVQLLTVTPTSGSVGTTVAVSGTGFSASRTVSITFGGITVATTPANPTTNSYGSFSASFSVPAGTSHASHIVATDGIFTASVTFTVKAGITLNPASAKVGVPVSVTGSGFTATTTVSVTFDGTSVGQATTDVNGNFSLSFNVPASPAGGHTITASDSFESVSATLTLVSSIRLSPSSGTAGSQFTVSGSAFGASTSVIVSFESSQAVTATSDYNGSFTVSLSVPNSSGGAHTVTATDGTNTATETFSTLARIAFTPVKGQTGAQVTVTGSGFAAGRTVTVRFADTAVRNILADANGGFSYTLTVPQLNAGNYNVTASDGSNTATFTFTITASVNLNATSGNVGSSLTVTGSGFSGTVTILYDGTAVATAVADADGAFSATFNVPASIHGNHIITASDGATKLQTTFTMDSTPPSAPVLLSPGDKTRLGVVGGITPAFKWSSATDPSGVAYVLQIDTNTDFTQPILQKTVISGTHYTLTAAEALPRGEYYWRVKTVDGASNESSWSQYYLLKSGLMATWVLVLIIILAIAVACAGIYYGMLRPRARRREEIAMAPFGMPQVVSGQWRALESGEATRERQAPRRLALPGPARGAKVLSQEDQARLKVVMDFAQSLPLIEPGYNVDWIVELIETGMGTQMSTPDYERLLKGELKVSYEPPWIRHPAYQDLAILLKGQPVPQELAAFIDGISRCAQEAVSLLQQIYRDAVTEVPPDFLDKGGWQFISSVYVDAMSWFTGKSLRAISERDYIIKSWGVSNEGGEERWLCGNESTSFAGQLILAPDEKEALRYRAIHLKLRQNWRNDNRARQVAAMITQEQIRRSRLLSIFSQFGSQV